MGEQEYYKVEKVGFRGWRVDLLTVSKQLFGRSLDVHDLERMPLVFYDVHLERDATKREWLKLKLNLTDLLDLASDLALGRVRKAIIARIEQQGKPYYETCGPA